MNQREEIKLAVLDALQEFQPESQDDTWVGLEGAAQRLGITKKTVINRIYEWKRGNLDLAKPFFTKVRVYKPKGCDYRFRKNDIDKYIVQSKL